jgi:hypothetical protein
MNPTSSVGKQSRPAPLNILILLSSLNSHLIARNTLYTVFVGTGWGRETQQTQSESNPVLSPYISSPCFLIPIPQPASPNSPAHNDVPSQAHIHLVQYDHKTYLARSTLAEPLPVQLHAVKLREKHRF